MCDAEDQVDDLETKISNIRYAFDKDSLFDDLIEESLPKLERILKEEGGYTHRVQEAFYIFSIDLNKVKKDFYNRLNSAFD